MKNVARFADHLRTTPRGPTMHELAVREIVRLHLGAQRRNLPTAVRKLIAEIGADDDCVPRGFVPDAYLINREASYIDLFEIEDTSALTTKKLRNICEFWFAWDAEGSDWAVRLFTFNRYGHSTGEIDLARFFYELDAA